jgi:hypothetical protein
MTARTPRHRFTPREIELIRRLYPTTPTPQLAAYLGCTVAALQLKTAKLGVYKTRAARAQINRRNTGAEPEPDEPESRQIERLPGDRPGIVGITRHRIF